MAPRIGFLGAGLIARLHAFGHQSHVLSTFAGVHDPDAVRAARVADARDRSAAAGGTRVELGG